jgi:hypothetical protein
MLVRIGVVTAVLASMVVLGMPWNGADADMGFRPLTAQAATLAAPAETSSSGLQFSKNVDSNGRAIDPRTEFGGGTDRVWASFEFRDHDRNATVSYLVRANGEDYKYGRLDCCDAGQGRYAFPIQKRNGNGELPGAAYDVRLYVNNVEVAHGGFGVNGRGGLDSDGQDYDNDND